jgi:hypothetical protein
MPANYVDVVLVHGAAEYDRMINPETQLFQAERMGAHVRTRPVDHTPMVTAPADVVAIRKFLPDQHL